MTVHANQNLFEPLDCLSLVVTAEISSQRTCRCRRITNRTSDHRPGYCDLKMTADLLSACVTTCACSHPYLCLPAPAWAFRAGSFTWSSDDEKSTESYCVIRWHQICRASKRVWKWKSKESKWVCDTKFEEYDSEVGKLELFAITKQLAKFNLLSEIS